MNRIAGGDSSAFEHLYREYSARLYSLALRIVGDSGAAEEILQDVFMQLWRKAALFDSSAGSLAGWLLTITRSRAISHLRRKSNRFYSESFDEVTAAQPLVAVPVSLSREHAASELVSSAIATLNAAQRQTIELAYFEGMTCEEIASRTNIPPGTIKTRLRSALQVMRKSLSNSGFSRSGVPQSTVRLEDILITRELAWRPSKRRSLQQETDSLRSLARTAASSPGSLINSFLQMPIQLCAAGTAGVSMLEVGPEGEQLFRWTNLAGRLEKYVGGTTPRGFSPCGVTLDRGFPQLFSRPGRYFHYFNDVEVPIVEGLVLPFFVNGEIQGTVWIVSHREDCRFDSEDVRIMTTLAEFTGAAFHLLQSQRRPPPQ